ncbi:MAG TPA: SpvB/TcaC N-terminal domain-containing protein, partial [Flavisolibacter sp.]|nr:SpvB/TcaC N-terminal domain-containing protein [Flavisolibacter sp.]
DANWLRKGDNAIRFTLPGDAQHGYKVRNLAIEVEKAPITKQILTPSLVLNLPATPLYFENKAYVKGFITGIPNGSQVKVNGNHAYVQNGAFEYVLESGAPANGLPWNITVEAMYGEGRSVRKILTFQAANKADFYYEPEWGMHAIRQMVKPNEKADIALKSAGVKLPAGALGKAEELSVSSLRKVDIPALEAGMVNVTAGASAYRFLPHPRQFQRPVQVRIGYDPSKIPGGYSEKDIRTFYFDESTNHWVALPRDSVSAKELVVSSSTMHFTDMINGIIKAPESPEVAAFTPNSIKGIQAASPATGVTLIAPPAANNYGSANLSFPIKLPAGRAGIQPDLSITYSSESGNGWLGMGWDLTVPYIGIDTRWGVPRYDALKETETYTIGSQQLTPVAHRGDLIDRVTVDRRFYPRVEGSFGKIIRHGDNPKNYSWEVIDKAGTQYLYGSLSQYTLQTPNGNIARWYLQQVKDVHGNVIRYYYNQVIDKGPVEGLADGKTLYLSKITYTGYIQQEGRYSVNFILDRDMLPNERILTNGRRKDISINARLGLKEVVSELLRKIEIKYDNTVVRSYKLFYKEGNFNKTLLDSIAEYDAAGSQNWAATRFAYYNDLVAADGTLEPFDKATTFVNGGDGNPRAGFMAFSLPITGPVAATDQASAIQGSPSFSGGFNITVAVGFGPDVVTKSNSIGISGGYTGSRSMQPGMLDLVDVNGDNRPDKIYVDGQGLRVRLNTSGANADLGFGNPITVLGIDRFFDMRSDAGGVGGEVNLGFGSASLFAAAGGSWSRQKTLVYLTDVNQDGLTDVAYRGRVYFNHYDPVLKTIYYDTYSSSSRNPINIDINKLDAAMTQIDPVEKDRLERENPLNDIVREWTAPYTGTVKLSAPVRLLPCNNEMAQDEALDGVVVSIESEDRILWTDSILPGDQSWHYPTGVDNILVGGDGIGRIFFRVSSRYNGSCDKVLWAPEISYSTLNYAESLQAADTTEKDANNLPLYKFSVSKDFLPTGKTFFKAPLAGAISINGSFQKAITTDTVRAYFLKLDTLGNRSVLWSGTYAAGTAYNVPVSIGNLTVDTSSLYSFHIEADSRIDYRNVQLNTTVAYVRSDDPAYPSVTDAATGKPLIQFRPVPDYQLYEVGWNLPGIIVPAGVNQMEITPVARMKPPQLNPDWNPRPDNTEPRYLYEGYTGNLVFTIKKGGMLVDKQKFHVTAGVFDDGRAPGAVTLSVVPGEKIYCEYYAVDAGKADDAMLEHGVSVRSIGGNTWQRATNVPAFAANIYRPYSGYRGWGYFGYNAGASTASGLTSIKRLELVTSKKLTESKLDKQSIDNLKGKPEQLQAYIDQNQNQLYDPKTEKLVYLVPAITDTSYGYMGQDEFTWVHGDTLSSSRLGADDIMGLLTLLGGSAKAPQKIAYNSSTYLSGGASAGGFAAGGGASYTYTFGGIARNDVDFIDLNGDRYPDFVRKGDIQFTRANGSLEERYVPNIFNSISGSDYYTHGLTASASFNTSHSKPYSFAVGSGQSKVGVQVGGGSNSLGLSGGFSKGFNEASYALVDINGDGLPDRLEKDGSVVLNLGYGFADHRENWRYGQIHKGGGESYSAGMGYTFANGSLEAGASLATGYNHVEGELIDINGDGLPDDVVKLNDGIKVRFNTGSGFGEQLPWPGLRAINVNTSTTLSFHAGFTFGVFFPIPILPLGGVKLVINPQVHFDFEQSRIIEDIRDINGDGFPDVISSNDKGEYLAANLSKIGRTNMLQAVIQPLGSSFVLDYKREGNTYDMPNSIWTLSKVIVRDGFNGDGADSLMTTFVYDSGYYSQREREFYGFRKVTTREHNTLNKNLVYRSNASTYINDNYYLKGLMEAQLVLDSAGRIYTRNDSRYELRNATSVLGEAYSRRPEMPLVGGVSQNDFDWAFPALKETVQSFYEGQAIAGMVSRMTFDSYDQYGNITQYTDFGNPAKPEDDLTSLITYQYITDNNKYIVGLPSNIRVLSNGKDYRVRSAAYDPVTGKPISMTMSGNPSRAAVYSMEYDGYGNIRKLTRPENGKGQRLTIEYTYDNSVNTFPVKVKNSYGDSSTAAYDYRFGQVLETTDPNGNRILNEIDALGRITKLTGPYELAAGAPYTIQFDYHPEAAMPFAISRHFDPSNPSNPLQTITFVDGLGRVIQAKKDISMFQGDGLPDKEMLTVSGKILYDGLGRPTHTFYPFAEDKGSETRLNPQSASSKPATVTTYDVLDRPVALTLADGAVTTSSYGFGNDRSNTQQFKTR